MDYKEKYNEALEKAKKNYDVAQDLYNNSQIGVECFKNTLTNIFPELKESKDERIRKELIELISCMHDADPRKKGWIAWLEKQGEQKHFSDFKAEDWYVSKVDGKIHNMTYNPTDKVKPEFKVGDFIANDYCSGKVIEITNDAYLLDTGQGIPFSCEHNAHLWTIADAKDGDVLVTTAIRNCPFIYRKTDYNNNLAYYYAGIDGSGDFCEGCIKRTSYHFGPLSNVVPATKEQRDQLFQKMEKAGYKWNAEKKELKNIEVVSKESKDERIKKTIIRILKGEIGYTSKEDIDKYVTWLEKQGKRLGADKVIAWLVANICDYEYYVKLFKKDFGL